MRIASLKPTEWFPGQKVSVKPHLRGWIHLVAAPLSLAASIVLTCLAPSGATKWGSAIYLAASLILFGISALYHRFYWSPRWEIVWNRLDHSNIFLLIAGHDLVNRLGRRAGRNPSQSLLADRSKVARNAHLRCFGVGCSVVPPPILGARGTGCSLASLGRRNLVHDRRDCLRNEETRSITSLVRVPRDLPYLHGSCLGVPLHRRVFDSSVNFPQIAQNPHFQTEGC